MELNKNLVKLVLEKGGTITQLLIDVKDSNGLGLTNPSIFIDNEELLMILRNVNYTLYHCENEQLFNNRWGPLSYLNPENDQHLRTTNFLCKLNKDTFEIESYSKIDTSKLDVDPLWEFVGLEDARLVRWNGLLYGIGVRRDTTTTGYGRMELSEIYNDIKGTSGPSGSFDSSSIKSTSEIKRFRIDPPNDPGSYCEKNWMPIIDMPYHFIRWTNPTEVVEVDIETRNSKTIYSGNNIIPDLPFLRGSSQVIPWGDFRICIVHECNLFNNWTEQKDVIYMHRFVIWDKNWNIVKITDPFSFMDGEIEFCCGISVYNKELIITFGFQDNAAFLLKIPKYLINNLLGLDNIETITNREKVEAWKLSQDPILEITTNILPKGCIINCVFCPQRTLVNSYNGNAIMTFINFKKIIDKIPKEIGIIFAGFSEPWLNKQCTDMVLYAHNNGHKISIFTTAIGMTLEDVNMIKDIPFAYGTDRGFTLHLPDNEFYAKHPITPKYIEVLNYIKEVSHQISNFRVISMGTVTNDVKDIFPIVYTSKMYSRAGNLEKEILFKPELLKLQYTSTYNGESNIACNSLEGTHHTVLLPNGDVTICCQDYELKHIVGNLYNQEYDDIIPLRNTPFNLCRFCENGKIL